MTPESRRAALGVWWNGPPWAILRNASFFLWRVWDYGQEGERDYAVKRIPKAAWIRAIDDAVPGEVSRGVVNYWGQRMGRVKDDEFVNATRRFASPPGVCNDCHIEQAVHHGW